MATCSIAVTSIRLRFADLSAGGRRLLRSSRPLHARFAAQVRLR